MKITKEHRDLIIGLSIGDGALQGGILKILQCEKQKKYVEWKKQLLNSYGIKTTDIKEKDNNGFKAYYFRTYSYDFIKNIYNYLYIPKKTITRKCLNRLNPLTIAIWYMDDGGLSQKKRNGKIHANDLILNTGLQKEENQIIIDYFNEVWDIHFTQVKNHNVYRLRCGTREARKFIKIIRPFVESVGCFDYKLNIKY